jgi:hypothetical protein
MAQQHTLAQFRKLQQAQRHLRWLQQHLPNSAVLRRTQREIFERRSSLCVALGCAGDRIGVQLAQMKRADLAIRPSILP